MTFLLMIIGMSILTAIVYFGLGWMKVAFGEATLWIASILLLIAYIALVAYGCKVPELPTTLEITELPETGPTIKAGLYYLLPVVVLVWCLVVERLSPGLSAYYATLFMLFVLLTQRPIKAVIRKSGEDLVGALKQGATDTLEGLISGNEIVLARTRDVGILTAGKAINSSITGPMLRASGVQWDLRKADPYEIYDRLDFDIPIGAVGDTYDRYIVRILEMRESVKIIEQCVRDIPNGPVRGDAPPFIRAPEGEAYASVEGPKGELGFYLVSDGGISPYRCHVRAPSFINLTVLRDMLVNWKMGDLIIIFGSIDVVMGEVDR